MNERQLAFKILNKIERDNAYSNLTLDAALRENAAASASSAFVTAIVYGVTERKITLDFILSRYLTTRGADGSSARCVSTLLYG